MQKTITTILLGTMLATGVASAQSSTSTASSTATTTANTKNICIAAAVNKRDSAMIVAHDAFAASVKAALTARKDGLVAAWTNGNKDARNAAWTKFKTDMKNAHEKMRSDRKAAWATFYTESKACGTVKQDNGKKWGKMNRDDLEMEHEHKVENATYSY